MSIQCFGAGAGIFLFSPLSDAKVMMMMGFGKRGFDANLKGNGCAKKLVVFLEEEEPCGTRKRVVALRRCCLTCTGERSRAGEGGGGAKKEAGQWASSRCWLHSVAPPHAC